VKGSIVRALIAALVDRHLAKEVAARVGPEAQALFAEPPLPTMWVDALHSNEIYQAILEEVGPVQLRAIAREAIAKGLAPLLRGTVERVLAIFGVSPATLLSRIDRAAGGTSRGMAYRYEVIDDSSGVFDLEFPALTGVPLGPFVASAGGLELIFELCHARGTFGDPEPVPNGRNNHMRYRVAWKSVTRG
jgi:hypothetical protein